MNRRILWAMVMATALMGCSKLTLENYNRLEPGMAYDAVTRLLGKPDQCDDIMGVRNCRWCDETRSVNVSSVGGKVLLFSASNLK
ncbi:MAG: hypothetical protein ACK4UX_06445 [Thiobacillus sp.]